MIYVKIAFFEKMLEVEHFKKSENRAKMANFGGFWSIFRFFEIYRFQHFIEKFDFDIYHYKCTKYGHFLDYRPNF